MSLNDKVAIVTGGNSGIGKAIALGLAKAGAAIVIDYVAHPEATEALEREIAALGGRGDRRRGRRQQRRRICSAWSTPRSRSSAASTSWSTTPASKPAPRCSTRPRRSTTRCSRSISRARFSARRSPRKQMIKQGGGGRIINITSVHEDWPMPGNTAYCLAKGGMRMLTRTAGVELAPHRHPRGRRRPRARSRRRSTPRR